MHIVACKPVWDFQTHEILGYVPTAWIRCGACGYEEAAAPDDNDDVGETK